MARQKQTRKILQPPTVKGFVPFGEVEYKEPILMAYEEYESIRLCDYSLLNQEQASKEMNISRPTFTRIYESARRKVAKALTEVRPLRFEGGKVYFDSDWFICLDCGCIFNNPTPANKPEKCVICGSIEIEQCKKENKKLDLDTPTTSNCFNGNKD